MGAVFKRALDIVVGGTVLLLFSPLLLIIATLVRWKMGAPVLFLQQRPGLNARPFTLVNAEAWRGGSRIRRVSPSAARCRPSSPNFSPQASGRFSLEATRKSAAW
jgi:hypothetical protein